MKEDVTKIMQKASKNRGPLHYHYLSLYNFTDFAIRFTQVR